MQPEFTTFFSVQEQLQIFVVSNKGLMRLRSDEILVEKIVLFKTFTVQDLLQTKKGAGKIQKYFEQARIGYVNAEGKHRINQALFGEINHFASTLKTENKEDLIPAISDVEAMEEAEYEQLCETVKKMANTILQMKKPESAASKENIGNAAHKAKYPTPFSFDQILFEVELKASAILSNLLKKFAEAAHEEAARKEEAYKKDQIAIQEIRQAILCKNNLKWDIQQTKISSDFFALALKNCENKVASFR